MRPCDLYSLEAMEDKKSYEEINGQDKEKLDITSTSSPTHGKVTTSLVLAAIVCFGGSSLQFGYNLVVVNAPGPVSMEASRKHPSRGVVKNIC